MDRWRIILSYATVFITSLLPAQTLEWVHGFGGTQGDIAYGVAVDANGDVITVGMFNLTMDLDPGAGNVNVTANGSADIFIRKVDASGQYLWGGRIGGTGVDEAQAVTVDASNNVIITGYFTGTADFDIGIASDNRTATAADVFVMKLSSNGALTWARTFGGPNNDRSYSVAVDPAGNVVTTGYFGNTMDIDPGNGTQTVMSAGGNDMFIQKLDANGALAWAHAIGGTGADQGWEVDVDEVGAVYVTGVFRNIVDMDPGIGTASLTSAGDNDIHVLKLGSNGSFSWAKRIGGTALEDARSIAVDGSHNVILTGRLTGPVDVDPGAGIVLLPGSFNEESFLLKLGPSGEFLWGFLLPGFLNNGLGLEVDSDNNVHTTGSFGSSMDIDPGIGTSIISSAGASDVYVASYTSDGALRWGFAAGGSANDVGHELAIGVTGTVHVAGEFRTTADMDPGSDLFPIVANGGNDAFVAKYTQAMCEGLLLSLRVVLEGAYRSADQLMVDSLRVLGFLPLQEPYTALGFAITGTGTTSAGVLAVGGNNAVVDWVVVELRDPFTPTVVIESRAGLLQRDGDVTGVDGLSPLLFCAPSGPYHLAVRHRNHLGVMTGGHLELTTTPSSVDLTLGSTTAYGTNARVNVNGTYALWPGNVVPDNRVKYTGENNDRDPILALVGSTTPNAVATGYWPEDVNLDGTVKYTGLGNDRDPILIVIGNLTPNNWRMQQLP